MAGKVWSLAPIARADAVARARRSTQHGTVYKLGAGGMSPTASTPGAECDCSGALAYWLGVSRFVRQWNPRWPFGEWLESSAIVRDAWSALGEFELVTRSDANRRAEPVRASEGWPLCRPGDVLAWGDSGRKQGHVGLVSRVDYAGRVLSVVHCSKGNERKLGDAIAETSPDVFIVNNALAIRCGWLR